MASSIPLYPTPRFSPALLLNPTEKMRRLNFVSGPNSCPNFPVRPINSACLLAASINRSSLLKSPKKNPRRVLFNCWKASSGAKATTVWSIGAPGFSGLAVLSVLEGEQAEMKATPRSNRIFAHVFINQACPRPINKAFSTTANDHERLKAPPLLSRNDAAWSAFSHFIWEYFS